MATYLITGVSAGDSGKVGGEVRVLNNSGNTVSFGWDSLAVPSATISRGESGSLLAINLESSYTPPPGTAITLPLSGHPLILASLGSTLELGAPEIENAAQAAYPSGYKSDSFGPRVVASFEGIYHPMDLSGDYDSAPAINVGMYLDGLITAPDITAGDQSRFGCADIVAPPTLKPSGIGVESLPVISVNRGESGSFVGLDLSSQYGIPPATSVTLPLSGAPLIIGTAGEQSALGSVAIENSAQAAYPKSIEGTEFGGHNRAWPGDGDSFDLRIDLTGNYQPPGATSIQMLWASEDKTLSPPGFTHEGYGTAIVRVSTLFLEGIFEEAFGETGIRNVNRKLAPGGIQNPKDDTYHVVENTAVPLYPEPIKHPKFKSEPYVYNSDQYLGARGKNQERFGEFWVLGGSKFIDASGEDQSAISPPLVINTTADQPISLKRDGIEAPYVPEPNVSPRIVYAEGVFGTEISIPLVQFPPFPVGWESSRYGRPEIDYWTKYALPEGIDPTENIGYPFVRDRAQKVYPPSFRDTTIFGDTAAENNAFTLFVEGLYASYYSNFADIRSNRRPIKGRGYDAQLWGDASIRNKTPSFAPIGRDLSLYGAPAIGHWLRYIYGRGFSLDNYGHASLSQTPSFAPVGIEGGFIGPVVVTHGERTLEVKGSDSQEYGEATVWFRVRGTNLEGFTMQAYGEPVIEYKNRVIRGDGRVADGYGRPWIGNANQTIKPEGVFKEFAGVHLVGGLQFIEGKGFDTARYGERIIPEIQSCYPEGFTGSFGQQAVYNFTQIAYPPGFSTVNLPTGRWGVGSFYNLRQYISMYYFVESQLNPPDWSRWTLIENRTKTIGAVGQNAQLFGYATLENNARLLSFEGIEAPAKSEFYEAGMVAYRVRRLPVQGLESPHISSWDRIYNDAFVIAPPGFSSDSHGHSKVETNRRYFRYIGGFKSERVGVPMIADRIRELVFERRYTIHPPSLWMPRVDLYTRYIDGIGEDLSSHGVPSLSIHFNKIRTRWSHSDRFGWANLRNLTPEVGQYGRASDVYGDALVRLEWRPVSPDGSRMERIGKHLIADRDRSIALRGFSSTTVSTKTKVIKTGQPPYTDQFIYLIKFDEDGEQEDTGFGIPTPGGKKPNVQVPPPGFNQYVLYPKGFKGDQYGEPFAQSNTIIVENGVSDSGIGECSLGLKNREVAPETAQEGGEPKKTMGKPRLSPHTIWARPAPRQADRNHPGDPFRPVGDNYRHGPGERFGRRTRISTYRGELYPRSAGRLSRVPKPRVQLKLRYIGVEGFYAYRNGWHKLGDGTQTVRQVASRDSQIFGKTLVERAPYLGPQDIKVAGVRAPKIPRHRVEFFNREVGAKGKDLSRMGTKKRGDNPYMWQGLRIGPLMPTTPDGYTNDSWGDAWVSFRVRDVRAEGFDAFASEYELESFEDRMRVSLATIPRPPAQDLAPVGVDVSSVSAPNVWPAARYILPDGNADQYRKGAPN